MVVDALAGALATLVLTAIGALTANYIWDWIKSPQLDIANRADLIPVAGGSYPQYRFRLRVENNGRAVAKGCQASISMLGTCSQGTELICLRHPLGWIENIDRTHYGKTSRLDAERDIGDEEIETLDLGRVFKPSESEGWKLQLQDRTTRSSNTLLRVDLNSAREQFVRQLREENILWSGNITDERGCTAPNAIPVDDILSIEWERSNLIVDMDNAKMRTWSIQFTSNNEYPLVIRLQNR